MKVLITGGGTGGHLYPALAVAEALRQKIGNEAILFIGSQRGLEAEEVPAEGYAFQALETIGFPRKPGFGSFKAAAAFFRAVLRARSIVKEFSPDVVFSTGGYASAPVVVAARLEGIPIVLHEQNSIPGRTNRIASRFACEVNLAFPSARRHFPKRRHLRLSGNPLRSTLLQGSRSRALRQFRLDEDRFTVLVLGGSQGSHAVNEAIVGALTVFAGRDDMQFLIQSGQRDHEWMVEQCRALNAKTWVRRFIPNMGDAYELADLVVGRAGAMTISEITACGLPSILIPYPYATANHQQVNAELLEEVGAAIMITEDRLTGALLAEQIDALIHDRRQLRQMALSAHRMARPDATDRIAAAIVRYLPGGTISEPPSSDRAPRSDRREGGERDFAGSAARSDPRRSSGERNSPRGDADRGDRRSATSGDRGRRDGGSRGGNEARSGGAGRRGPQGGRSGGRGGSGGGSGPQRGGAGGPANTAMSARGGSGGPSNSSPPPRAAGPNGPVAGASAPAAGGSVA